MSIYCLNNYENLFIMNKLGRLNIYFSFFFLLTFPLWLSAQRIPMTSTGGVYTIPCEVNGLKLNPILDTGASSVSISLTEALFMLRNGYLSSSDILGTEYYRIANGDIVEGTGVILRKVKIGNKYIYNVKASVSHTINAPLLLGQSVLNQLGKFTVDYSSKTLIIGSNNSNTYTTNSGHTTSGSSYPTNNSNNTGTHSWTLEKCKLRSRPTAIGEVIAYVNRGDDIEILTYAEAGYYQVRCKGMTGYINESYIHKDRGNESANIAFTSPTKHKIEGIFRWVNNSKLYRNGRLVINNKTTLPEDFEITKNGNADNFALINVHTGELVGLIMPTASSNKFVIKTVGIRGSIEVYEFKIRSTKLLEFTKTDRDPNEYAEQKVELIRIK